MNGVIETSKESISMAREIASLRENDLKRVGTLGRLSGNALTIYEGLFDKPTVRIEEVMNKLAISNSTASRLIDKMIEIGILSSLGNGKRKKVYVYRSYMEIFSKD